MDPHAERDKLEDGNDRNPVASGRVGGSKDISVRGENQGVAMFKELPLGRGNYKQLKQGLNIIEGIKI